jgi:hypothetical protein
MKRIAIAAFVIVLVSAVAVWTQAPASAPKPAPELKKLAVYVGQWKYDGEYKPGLMGPAGKATGDATCEMILRGFFLEWRWREQVTTVETRGFEVISYDPVSKTYPSSAFGDDGSSSLGAYVLDGNISCYSGKLAVGGKQYLSKVSEVFAADSMSFMQKAEISSDGNTWTPLFEAKFTKVESAPNKLN